MRRDVLVQERADTPREVPRAAYDGAGRAESYVARTVMYDLLPRAHAEEPRRASLPSCPLASSTPAVYVRT